MKMLMKALTALVFVGSVCGCASNTTQLKKYAELRIDNNEKMQLLICYDEWLGVVTVHGYGGYAHGIDCWAALIGKGPVYVDPIFHENAPIPPQTYRGTITIDREHQQAIIDLRRVISNPGDPERLEAISANGTYPIRRTNHEPFLSSK